MEEEEKPAEEAGKNTLKEALKMLGDRGPVTDLIMKEDGTILLADGQEEYDRILRGYIGAREKATVVSATQKGLCRSYILDHDDSGITIEVEDQWPVPDTKENPQAAADEEGGRESTAWQHLSDLDCRAEIF